MTRILLAALTIGSLSLAAAAAQTPAAADGCRSQPPESVTARRWQGSVSAKGSVPIGRGESPALAPRRERTASNSPKASTPLLVSTKASDRPRARAVLSAKASVPARVGGGASAPAPSDGCKQ
jgi:hypothetical protein